MTRVPPTENGKAGVLPSNADGFEGLNFPDRSAYESLVRRIRNLKLVALDCDGTLWIGDSALRGAIEITEMLRGRGIAVVALTNNSTRSRENLADKGRKLGLSLGADDYYATNHLAAKIVAERHPSGHALVIGSRDFCAIIESSGVDVHRAAREFDAIRDADLKAIKYDAVVVGLSVHVTYAEICAAVVALQNGADFIATNSDYTFPACEGYFYPGNGSFVELIARVSGVTPLSLGKPEPHLLASAMRDHTAATETTLVVGDRVETDILCGKNAGALTCLVKTGVSAHINVETLDTTFAPDIVTDDLRALAGFIAKMMDVNQSNGLEG